MFFFSRIARALKKRVFSWWKKKEKLYRNTALTAPEASIPKAFVHSASSNSSIPYTSTCVPKLTNTHTMDTNAIDQAQIQAVATGVDQQTQTGRKGRVRKTGVAGASLAVKSPKAPKAKRNPFRRSDTTKLQLKSLQMGKRVETMTPRVALLHERVSTMSSRLEFIVGKLALVREELAFRTTQSQADENSGGASTDVPVETARQPVEGDVGSIDEDENIELDDEIVTDDGSGMAPV